MPKYSIYTVGGTVQAGGGLYLPRRADEEMLAHCLAGNFSYVLTARQLGKSSLMVRTAEQLAAQGVRTAVIDLTELGIQATASEWYLGFILKLAFELSLETDIFAWWAAHNQVGLAQRLVLFFREVVLPQAPQQIVIFIDEIDCTLSLPFTDDFFAAIRYLYNARAVEPALSRASFVLIGVATPGDLIDDPKRTPFNIGERVELSDFTFAEAEPLATHLAPDPHQAREILSWILHWTGGHPYLTQRLCKTVSSHRSQTWSKRDIAGLVQQLFLGEMSRTDSHLQFVRDMLTKRAPDPITVLQTYRDIRLGWRPVRDEEHSVTKSHLKLSGVVYHRDNKLLIRNPIYRQLFDRRWLNEHLPTNWWRDMPWEVKIAAGISALLLLAFLVSSLLATRNAHLANERARLAQARYLTAQSALFLDAQYDLALLLGLEAYNVSDTQETEAYLRYALIYNPYLLTYLRRHNAPVNSFTFSPDGRILVSAGADERILLWDVASGGVAARPLPAPTHGATTLAFSPDGTRLASGGCAQYGVAENRCLQGEIVVWDMGAEPTAVNSLQAHRGEIWDLAFNTSGNWLASTSNLDLILWDTATWKPVWEIAQTNNRLISLDFNPAIDSMLAAGTENGDVLVFDAATGGILHEVPAHRQRVYKVTFSPDGKLLASSSRDGVISLWDTNTWQPITHLTKHTDQVVSIDFNPDGKTLVSSGLDGQIILWDVASGVVELTLFGHQGPARELMFNPDPGQQMLVSKGPDNAMTLWQLEGDKSRRVWLSGHTDSVLGVDFTLDGSVLASASADNSIILWDVAGAELIGQISAAHLGTVRRVAFDPAGRYLASAGHDHQIRLWPIAHNLSTPVELAGHTSIVRSLSFSPDGNRLLSSDDAGQIILWDVPAGKLIAELTRRHEREIFDVEFSPDGKIAASGSWDGAVQFWDIDTLQPIGEPLQTGIDQIWDITFHPTAQLLVVAGSGEKIVFVDVLERRIVSQLLTRHANRTNALAFTPDGALLASGGANNVITLWSVPEQQMVGPPLQLHSDQVYTLAFSPDGRFLASGDLAGKILLTTIHYESLEGAVCEMVARNLTPTEWTQYIGTDYAYHKICPDLP